MTEVDGRLPRPLAMMETLEHCMLLFRELGLAWDQGMKVENPHLITWSCGLRVERFERVHSYADSDEPWWPSEYFWNVEARGIPGIEVLGMDTGSSAPPNEELYVHYWIRGEEAAVERVHALFKLVLLMRAAPEGGWKLLAHPTAPKEWSTDAPVVARDMWAWLSAHRYQQNHDWPLVLFDGSVTCAGFRRPDGSMISVGPLPRAAPASTSRSFTRDKVGGADDASLLFSAMQLEPSGAPEPVFAGRIAEAPCILDAAIEPKKFLTWRQGNWWIRQSLGSSLWGGKRSAYAVQPIHYADAAIALFGLFEIYGGGATCSVNLRERNSQLLTLCWIGDPDAIGAPMERLTAWLRGEGWTPGD
jgi:hypothetical protein